LADLSRGRIRTFWVGANNAQDSAGIIQGLGTFGEVILFESRPGKREQMWPFGPDGERARRENSRQLLLQVRRSLARGPLHAVIGQMWAHSVDPATLQEIRDIGVPVVNISMDDRHAFHGTKNSGRWSGTAGLIGSIDLACTSARECCTWYAVEGCPAIYLPEGSDAELFKPLAGPKQYDVCFVGGCYGVRQKIVKGIEAAGVKVAAFGNGWPSGAIATGQIPELFARSLIVLGVGTIGHCTDFYALKMRDFDGPMSGSLYLTHHNPDLEEHFVVGKEIETYRTIEECVGKIEYYRENPDEASRIGLAGRRRAEKEHTWEKRFEMVFRTIGLLG
jgi:hypothetical protein